MCVYCNYDKSFWDKVVEGAKRIQILTPEEVERVEEQMARQGNVDSNSIFVTKSLGAELIPCGMVRP